MIIEGFEKENLEGIKLKQGEIKECPVCGGEDHHEINKK